MDCMCRLVYWASFICFGVSVSKYCSAAVFGNVMML